MQSSKPRARLYDVDGTLCDVTDIRYLVDPGDPDYPGYKNFDKFHELSIDCPPHQRVVDALWQDEEDGVLVIVVTARAERSRTMTRWWLAFNGVVPHEQHHRADYDYRPDTEVKRDILNMLREKYEIVGAWDDNPRIIALWESEGIHVDVMPGWPEREEEAA